MGKKISVSSRLCLFLLSNAVVLGVIAPSYAESFAANTISEVKASTLKVAMSIDEKNLSGVTEASYFNSSQIPKSISVFPLHLRDFTVNSAAELAQVQPVQTRDRQAHPNQDRFPQTAPLPTPLPPDSPPPVQAPPTTAPLPASTPADQTIQVQKINITGSTVFKPKDLKSIIQPLEGRTTSIQELENATNAITQLYLDRGYINSRAFLLDPKISDGLVEIRVIEGRVQRIVIEGTHKLHPK